jgi:hypothetical protein
MRRNSACDSTRPQLIVSARRAGISTAVSRCNIQHSHTHQNASEIRREQIISMQIE